METERKALIAIAVCIGIFVLILWSPWITDEYAITQVTQFLGGPDALTLYNGNMVAVKDIPKIVSWAPFGKEVWFSGERSYTVGIFGVFMIGIA